MYFSPYNFEEAWDCLESKPAWRGFEGSREGTEGYIDPLVFLSCDCRILASPGRDMRKIFACPSSSLSLSASGDVNGTEIDGWVNCTSGHAKGVAAGCGRISHGCFKSECMIPFLDI